MFKHLERQIVTVVLYPILLLFAFFSVLMKKNYSELDHALDIFFGTW